MALMLVPVVLLGASAAAGGKGLFDTYKANKKRHTASERKEKARLVLERGQAKTERAKRKTEADFARLMTVRLMALSQLDEVVAWLKRGKVRPEEWETIPDAEDMDIEAWDRMGVEAGSTLRDVFAAAAGAAGTRAAVTAAAGHFGVASTGTAISGLSGAAAHNAMMAFLGGGALTAGGGGMALGATVLGSLNVGFAALGVGFTARKAAAAYDTASRDFAARCQTEARNLKNIRKSMFAIGQRCDQLRRAVNGVAHKTRWYLDQGDPEDRAQWMAVVGLGKALSRLARYKVLDEAGKLAEGWENPYRELHIVGLEPEDADFTRAEA